MLSQISMPPLPEKFVESLFARLGESDARVLCEVLDGESPAALRLNPFKVRGRSFETAGEPLGWSRWGRILDSRPVFTLDTAFHAGCYYVQEPSSQFVGHILSSTGIGSGYILDLCAAPGGKTTLYAAMAGTEGLVVANEPVAKRAAVLADNVRKWGVGNVVVTCDMPHSFALSGEKFDVVAVDAPCSGEGMFRKDKASRLEWSERGVRECAARQAEILREAWTALTDGGVLLYSTCTFNRSENEDVLEAFSRLKGGELVETEPIECHEEWGIETGRVGAFRTFRFWPHRTVGEGFFVAVARKSGAKRESRNEAPRQRRVPFSELAGSAQRELLRWFAHPDAMRFASIGDSVYAMPAVRYDTVRRVSATLNAIYSGVEAGKLYGGELKPAHALAMYFDMRREAVNVAELQRDAALDYLRKADMDVELLSEGLNLVVCDGDALGFVKRIGRRCNNGYPNSLRIVKC